MATDWSRYGNLLPADLRERYEAALHDPNLLSMLDEIAIVNARLMQLVERIEASDRQEGQTIEYAEQLLTLLKVRHSLIQSERELAQMRCVVGGSGNVS